MFFGVMQQSKKVEINYDGSNVTVSRMSHSGFVAFSLSLLVVHFYTHYTKHEFFKSKQIHHLATSKLSRHVFVTSTLKNVINMLRLREESSLRNLEGRAPSLLKMFLYSALSL